MAHRGLVGESRAPWCIAKGHREGCAGEQFWGKLGRHNDVDRTSVILTVRDTAATQVLLPVRGNTG